MNVSNVEVRMTTKKRYRPGRMYFNVANETVLEDLINRRSRPYNEFRKLFPVVRDKLKEMGYDTDIGGKEKVRWSQYAGCTCPCSPGFILDSVMFGRNIFVTVE